ncbi:DEAD/DEAH box helicase [Actinomyces vulturis]|uniref:DEAD/DEAH box helicase n=1 Tax=Actinomyces vulturis TaxID=1857645 RepID=UPI000837348C|nr:DEAD/DEAH box helicase [Actinomyces vulturis]
MTTQDLTTLLTRMGQSDQRLIHLITTPPRQGTTAPWPQWTHPDLVSAYGRMGIEQPWRHQVQAAEALWDGEHTIITTGTGSGKSLAAWLPILSSVLRHENTSGRISTYSSRPTALYICPTKALAADQVHSLEGLIASLEQVAKRPAGSMVRVSTCDGDTSRDARTWARAHADVIVTNPDYLHHALLPSHERWTRFLRSLRFLIIDEAHAYRGVMGAHVGLVIRRLLRLARALGSEPTVLCASATAGEAALTASRLIAVDPSQITCVVDDASPSGRRTLAFWQPAFLEQPVRVSEPGKTVSSETKSHTLSVTASPPVPTESDNTQGEVHQARRSALSEASHILAELLSVDARALVFVRSRRAAEIVAEQTRSLMRMSGYANAESIAAYRGGYLPEERRELEQRMRSGDIRALATTNALELGIDISGLDAVLIAGWPGTRVSLGQQAGRAGRAGSDGIAVLIASDDPLDSYLVHHPDDVFASPEATVFDPANPYVMAPHMCAAASERPLTEADFSLFGLKNSSFLDSMVAKGALRRRPTGWFYNTSIPVPAHELTNLRGNGPPDVAVVDKDSGAVIGTVDGTRADATVHPGAIYIHQGATFVVTGRHAQTAFVEHKPALGVRTRAKSTSSVRITQEKERLEVPLYELGPSHDDQPLSLHICRGSVEVTNQVVGFSTLSVPSMDTLGFTALHMPEHTLPTSAVWWTLDPEVFDVLGIDNSEIPGALHAAEHASIGLLPLVATCDRWDIGGLSTNMHPETMRPTVFVYDGHAGGAGFAERGFRSFTRWIDATLAALRSCGCSNGCPSCVQSPKCGNNNDPLNKAAATMVLETLSTALAGYSATTTH